MTYKLSRPAYKALIAEDIKWLMAQPRTLEREHIRAILDKAVEYEYKYPTCLTVGCETPVVDHGDYCEACLAKFNSRRDKATGS